MSGLTDYLDSLDNLAGGWNLASTEGDDPDVSGNGNDAVITVGAGSRGATAIEAGGTLSLDYDGSNTKAQVADDSAIQNIFHGGGTIFALLNADSAGENDSGFLFVKGGGLLFALAGGGVFQFQKHFTGSPATGQWIGSLPTATSLAVGVRYDADSPSNNPTISLYNISAETLTTLTVGSGLTRATNPMGDPTSDASLPLVIGNDSTQTFTFDGRISVFRMYSDVLTDGELNTAFGLTSGSLLFGTADSTLQPPTFTGSGAQTVTGTLAATLQKALFEGTSQEPPKGDIASILRAATFSGAGAQTHLRSTMQAMSFSAGGETPPEPANAQYAPLYTLEARYSPTQSIGARLAPVVPSEAQYGERFS